MGRVGKSHQDRGCDRRPYDTQVRDCPRRRPGDFCRLARSRQCSGTRRWVAWRWVAWWRLARRRLGLAGPRLGLARRLGLGPAGWLVGLGLGLARRLVGLGSGLGLGSWLGVGPGLGLGLALRRNRFRNSM